MSLNFDDLKEFLRRNSNSEMFYSPRDLYKGMVFLEKGDNVSKFDIDDLNDVFEQGAYRYYTNVGLHNVGVEVPFTIDSNLSFEDFREEFRKYNEVVIPDSIIPNDTLYDRLIRRVKNKALMHEDRGGWTHFDYAKIQGDGNRENEIDRKIYLAVDNEHLHKFALSLLEKCDELGIKYDFKINADDSYRRADNVVIYTSDEDFPQYIAAIEAIKEENPNFNFGRGNLLAYPYNDYIRVAPSDKNPKLGSHSSILCDKIFDIFYTEKDFDKAFSKVEALMTESLSETAEFCEKERKKYLSVKPQSKEDEEKFTLVNDTLEYLKGLTPNAEITSAIVSFENYLKQNYPDYSNKKVGIKNKNNSISSSNINK